ncbi:amidohydrolase family protein [Ulvibacter antarcticus]|uniref:Imidazolonepropionase-like amidohydrolase n=1 Tax=Ulvibacter antarcticus TaxID=442714 RepID=A0A3L9Z017_9FLAO|nr:amidohydrolase family protein [Ulvibacter antarcticus]RMA64709.1 imidazolonepropionase-like amidohydrolase [Ulvibacter antarcticus]
MNKVILIVLLIFTNSLSHAQSFIVNNVTLFDGETITENTSVLIENGTITKIGTVITSEEIQIDGTGKFLMPALTNSHVHAFMAGNLTQAASAGVLNLLDMHGMEQSQKAMQQKFADSTNYARYYYAGAAATAPNGHGTQFGFPSPTLTTTDEAQAFVDTRLASGAAYIKIIVEPWKPTLTEEVVSALIDATHQRDKKAVVHISKVEDAVKVLQDDADGLVHIWWDTEIGEEDLKSLASEKKFFVIPTLLTSITMLQFIRNSAPEGSFLSNEAISNEVKRLYDAGIPILAGTDPPNANINYGSDLYKELKLLHEAGMSAIDVLKTATSNPAIQFNLEGTGFIKEGFNADMILLDKNPTEEFENMNSIVTIWKDGKIVKHN